MIYLDLYQLEREYTAPETRSMISLFYFLNRDQFTALDESSQHIRICSSLRIVYTAMACSGIHHTVQSDADETSTAHQESAHSIKRPVYCENQHGGLHSLASASFR